MSFFPQLVKPQEIVLREPLGLNAELGPMHAGAGGKQAAEKFA
jgi:hypothetical protein